MQLTSLQAVTQMDAYASRLDDPQCAGNGMSLQDCQEISQSREDRVQRRPWSKLQNDDSAALFRRESQNVSEVMVECNQHSAFDGTHHSAFDGTHLEQLLVGNAAQILVADRHHIVAGRLEQLPATTPDILVELELHAARSLGTGTMRSRAASAP